jgi:hypothetical protein
MFAMIWRVQIHAVPTRRESMIDHNPHRTRLVREGERLRLPRTLILHADVRQLAEVSGAFAVDV